MSHLRSGPGREGPAAFHTGGVGAIGVGAFCCGIVEPGEQ